MIQNDPLLATLPAIAALELATIARGIVTLDQMAKRAEVEIVAARTFSPGRYLIVLSGRVAEIEEAMDAARSVAGEDLVDEVIIRDPAEEVRAALASELAAELDESLAIFELKTISATLLAADRALKDAATKLIELRLGAGICGRGVFTLTGPLHMVEAAREAVLQAVGESRVHRLELIAKPHPDLPKHLLGAELPAARR